MSLGKPKGIKPKITRSQNKPNIIVFCLIFVLKNPSQNKIRIEAKNKKVPRTSYPVRVVVTLCNNKTAQ